MAKLNRYKLENGTLMSHAFPGGYPLFYVDGHNNILCADCATEALNDEIESFRPAAADINWEDMWMHCESCNEQIECAYPQDEEQA